MKIARRWRGHSHPALEVIDDTLYVTVHTTVQGVRGYTILSSDGEVFSPAEWAAACRERQFAPLADVRLARCAPRWHGAGIRDALLALRSGADCTPTWPGVYAALHAAMDARLQVCDERYLALGAVYALMTYFFPLFDFLPILHLRGPAESGKSRLAHVLAALAFNGATFGCATDATLFRYAHEGRYTQLITEADHLSSLVHSQ